MARVLRLPDHGRLLVCTDLQGCLRDFERFVQIFEHALLDYQGDAHVLFTGDLIAEWNGDIVQGPFNKRPELRLMLSLKPLPQHLH